MGLERRGWAALRVAAEGVGLAVGVAAVIAGAGVAGVTLYAPPVASHGPLPGAAECTTGYATEAVADRAFAFDGTVTHVGDVRGVGAPTAPMVPVTFEVHTWYHGGPGGARVPVGKGDAGGAGRAGGTAADGDTVTVDLPAPLVGSGVGGARRGPSYGLGTRLLVSGEVDDPATGALTAAGCGFTRYHDVATAAAWASLD